LGGFLDDHLYSPSLSILQSSALSHYSG